MPHRRLAHGDELFRRRRVHRHGGVEIGLGRAGLHGDADELDHLARAFADDVAADHAVGRGVDHELHQHAARIARQRRLERPEVRLVDVDAGEALARLGLGEPDDADLRLGEHRGRNVDVVDGGRPSAEQRIGDRVAFANGDGRQIDPVGDVADREDVRDRGARIAVDGDAAIVGDGDAGVLDAEIGDVGLAADREHHPLGDEPAAVAQRRGIAAALRLDRLDELAGDDLDAARFHLAAQMRAHVVVEAAQNVLAAIDERHLRAEPGEDAGELDRDVAAALDDDAFRQRGRDETPRSR